MTELYKCLALAGAGILAGFINVMAGGGSAFTMPILIFAGLDPITANGTNRVAIFLQNASAIRSFVNEKDYDFRQGFIWSLWTLPGAIAGAIIAVHIDENVFKTILAGVIILVIASLFIRVDHNATRKNRHYEWLMIPALLGIGFYGGFLQAGVGFLFMAAYRSILKMDLIQVNMNKIFIILIYTLPALIVFIVSGHVHILYALSLAAGTMTGAWWSAKLSIKKGDRLIRIVLLVAACIMALKLLNIF
ncbi:MAG: sulfite exporter TauE/SafE family protein [candidate division KSB1 bacterium]|nr:sulfite exporter TauE/SafE family protein [candidate division KSB1 bacterium]